jgi:hypothetical protein
MRQVQQLSLRGPLGSGLAEARSLLRETSVSLSVEVPKSSPPAHIEPALNLSHRLPTRPMDMRDVI